MSDKPVETTKSKRGRGQPRSTLPKLDKRIPVSIYLSPRESKALKRLDPRRSLSNAIQKLAQALIPKS